MSFSRRHFIKKMGMGLAAVGLAAENLACSSSIQKYGSEKLLLEKPDFPEPAPVGTSRLSLSWYKDTVRRLKEKISKKGIDAILLGSDTNMVYFTGCFRGSGERSTWAFFPVQENDTVYWFAPGIDRDLITSWWCTEYEYYFCYPHAENGFPNKGQVVQGKSVDLFEWMLKGLKNHGFQGKTIGIDIHLHPDFLKKIKLVLPDTSFIDISEDCLRMRMIKTPEEIALTQRAYRYFDKVHAFARDYIFERGTDATDFEIGQALQAYGIQLMMKDIDYDGTPHKGVGMEMVS